MAVKHDALIPYLEIGRLSFHAFITDLDSPNKIDLEIIKATPDNPFTKTFEAHNQSWNKSLLVELLQKERVETVFGLRLILTTTEIQQLNERKSEILDYLVNLDNYYRGPHA